MKNNTYFHIGCMRTGSTFLQNSFKKNNGIGLLLKSRFFSYDFLFNEGISKYEEMITEFSDKSIIIDSDENYSLGRFKTKELNNILKDHNIKAEQFVISHDITKMCNRIKQVCPNSKIIIVIRQQIDWLLSVYKHDVLNIGIDQNFLGFYESNLGRQYRRAGDYLKLIQLYEKNFGTENIKVLFYEDLKNSPSLFLNNLSEFINCPLDFNDISDTKRNRSLSNFDIKLLAKANLLSQKNPEKKEYFFYKLLRNIIIRTVNICSKYNIAPNTALISSDTERSILNSYTYGNKKVAQLIGASSKMKEYGYF